LIINSPASLTKYFFDNSTAFVVSFLEFK
jgi:hypothetical protein